MGHLAELAEMAKRGRPAENRDDATARIDRGVLARAQMVARAHKVKLAEYLTSILKDPVDRDFLAVMEALKDPADPKDSRSS